MIPTAGGTVSEAYEALKREFSERTESTAIAIHQLRSPLSSIQLVHQSLLAQDAENLTEEQVRLIKLAGAAAEQMQEQLRDLLALEQLESSPLRTQEHREYLEQLLDDTLLEFDARIKRKRLVVLKQYDPASVHIQFDYDKLQVAISNILDNAIKYTPEEGTITLATSYAPEGATMRISDTGIGVDEGDAPQLFQKFTRMKNAKATGVIGSGLGLYIARRAVEKHGGVLTYQHNVPHGSIFTIAIPNTAH